jgi:flagellar protein FliL
MAVAKPTKKSRMLGIVVILLLTLVAAGAGLAVGLLPNGDAAPSAAIPAPANAETSAEAKVDEKAVAEPVFGLKEDLAELKVFAFPPVLTTLAEPKGKWIRVEGSILISPEADQQPEMLAEKSGEQILTYLRTLRLDQMEGPSGLLSIRADLNETVSTLTGGQVKGVLIHGIIVE